MARGFVIATVALGLVGLAAADASAATGGVLLRQEVARMRAEGLQSPLLAVSDVRLLRQTVDPVTLESRKVAPGSLDGPWTLDAVVQGAARSSYDHPYRVSLRVGPKYPRGPAPVVRVKGTMHHIYVDPKLRDLAPDTVELLFRNSSSGNFDLDQGLRQFAAMLERPLGATGVKRWHDHAKENAERLDVIHRYAKLRRHPEVFEEFQDAWLDPILVRTLGKLRNETVSQAKRRGLVRKLMREEADGVYSFPVFTREFCERFLEELDSFYASKLPVRRPNSMNNYGVIVNDIGMEAMITSLQESVLQPLIGILFRAEGSELDGHHSFIVRYKNGEDTHLDVHHDDSDVTFNVCLGRNFTGAGLVLCGRKDAPDHRVHRHTYYHQVGRAILHLGRHRHGADDISDGERLNLIVWNHAYNWRKSRGDDKDPKSREKAPPDPECLSYTHDRDYGRFKRYPPGKEDHRGKGWCPPAGQEYPGFRREEL